MQPMKRKLILDFKLWPKLFRNLLFWLIFRYDKWHLRNFNGVRQYQETAAKLTLEFEPALLVELGCGLGQISELIPVGVQKILIDHDRRLQKPINFIFRKHNIEFIHADFLEPENLIEKIGHSSQIDVLIFVNAAHNLSESNLINLVAALHENFNIKFLLIDLKVKESESFRHDIEVLDSICELKKFTLVPDLSTGLGTDAGLAILTPRKLK